MATNQNKEQVPYLTKRRLVSAARKGFRIASEETMHIMGYNVVVMNGWVVKKYADGRVEQLNKIIPINVSIKNLLD
jgi:hypothetical protein